MTKLKPCPFCGGEAFVDYDERCGDWFVGCMDEECFVNLYTRHKSELPGLIERWNRRAHCTPNERGEEQCRTT